MIFSMPRIRSLLVILAATLAFIFLILGADAACPYPSCGADKISQGWEDCANNFLNSDVPMVGADLPSTEGSSFHVQSANVAQGDKSTESTEPKAGNAYPDPSRASSPFVMGGFIENLLNTSGSDLLLDVSNGDRYSRVHAKGAVHLPSLSFVYKNGTLRPVREMAKVLGAVSIKGGDSVVIYGDDLREATFVFWVMRYLGHRDVKVLDGSMDDWANASLPMESERTSRPSAKYTPEVRADLLANYDYVKSGSAQMVDARDFGQFGSGRVPGSIFIDPSQVTYQGKIKEEDSLKDVFARLERSRPVVVYSGDGLDASVVWYALQLAGFDSRLYTWNDWASHQQSVEARGSESSADSGPTRTIDGYRKIGG